MTDLYRIQTHLIIVAMDYMDDLSRQLTECRTGCMIGDKKVNHLMYADDLVVLSPSSAGFQQLLNVCSVYGAEHDIKYNASKSHGLICRTKEDQKMSFPDFNLSNHNIVPCKKVKYLGHFLTEDMTDDDDIRRQCCKMYAQANTLARRFHSCTDDVKISLFKAYCTPLYTAYLWINYKKASMKKLQVAYNDALRILLKRPRWLSASEMFVNARVNTFNAVLRNLMYRFMCRLDASENQIINSLTHINCSSIRYQSLFWRHWYSCLFLTL